MKWALYNTVWYDGVDAWVAKFILKKGSDKEMRKDIEKCGYDGCLLLIEENYEVSLDNIIALGNDESKENNIIYERFKNMYFS